MSLNLKETCRNFWLWLVNFRAILRGKAVDNKRIIKKIHTIANQSREREREYPLVISLTSFPQRINEVCCTIYSLFEQSCKPDRILLWLAEEEFSDHTLPEELYLLQEYGLEIRWTTNLFSYKKIIPSLHLYPKGIIVIVDDDFYYPQDWLKKLYTAYLKDQEKGISNRIYAHKAHRITVTNEQIAPYNTWKMLIAPSSSVLNMAIGNGGVLYPPHSLHADAAMEERFMQLCPRGDDIWLWGMTVLNGYQTKVVDNNITRFPVTNYLREKGLINQYRLYTSNRDGGNDHQIQALIAHYPELLQKVRQATQEELQS